MKFISGDSFYAELRDRSKKDAVDFLASLDDSGDLGLRVGRLVGSYRIQLLLEDTFIVVVLHVCSLVCVCVTEVSIALFTKLSDVTVC